MWDKYSLYTLVSIYVYLLHTADYSVPSGFHTVAGILHDNGGKKEPNSKEIKGFVSHELLKKSQFLHIRDTNHRRI
mgnify:FL=1